MNKSTSKNSLESDVDSGLERYKARNQNRKVNFIKAQKKDLYQKLQTKDFEEENSRNDLEIKRKLSDIPENLN